MRTEVIANKDALHLNYEKQESDFYRQFTAEWDAALAALDAMTVEFTSQRNKSKAETKKIVFSNSEEKNKHIEKLIDGFCREFSPKEFVDEYSRIYSIELVFDHYECVKEMPCNIFISTLEI